MSENLRSRKDAVRNAVRLPLRTMSAEQRRAESDAVSRALIADAFFMSARTILAYYPTPDEVDPMRALRAAHDAGARICFPTIDWESSTMRALQPDRLDAPTHIRRHGIREPSSGITVPPDELDLVLVPGTAFDRLGGRLGRGAGFYDRYLSAAAGRHWGVCFAVQLVPEVPREPHDQPMHALATPGGVLHLQD